MTFPGNTGDASGSAGLSPPGAVRGVHLDEQHRYWVDGERWPSVTELLQWSGLAPGKPEFVSDEVWEYAAHRGTMVHEACALLVRGELDWDTVDDEIMPYVQSAAEWWAGAELEVIGTEVLIKCETLHYCGTADLIARDRSGCPVVPDWKTSAPYPWHGDQLAAYGFCAPGYGTPKLLGVYLRTEPLRDGSLKALVKEYNYDEGLCNFSAACRLWKTINQRYGGKDA